MNGASFLSKSLESENVEYVFGYPGVAICPFVDALSESKIKTVLVRCEQNAAHAASGYARANETVGVCFATSGPGATNLITGIATAFADSIPMVVITGQVKSDHIGSDMFQEADIIGAAESFVKYSYLVKNAGDIPRIVKEAFYIASTGRKGPVLIDIPVDVLLQEAGEFKYPKDVNLRTYKPVTKGHSVQIKKVTQKLVAAKQPIICIGGGVILSGAGNEVLKFAKKYRIPMVCTMMGIGAVSSYEELFLGMVGNNGNKYANKAMNESDVLIVVGARIADRAVKHPDLITNNKVLIHIDIDTAEIGKNAGVSIPIVGDAKSVFEDLNEYELDLNFEDWFKRLESFGKTRDEDIAFNGKLVNPSPFIQLLSEKMEDDAVYVSDIGQNLIYSVSNYVSKNGKFLTSGGMGTMGYSIPAMIGAKLSNKDRQVVCVCGDGSFQMAMSELGTIKDCGIAAKILVFKNKSLGMIKEYQHNRCSNRYFMEDLGDYPYLDKIAEGYGFKYLKTANMDHIDEDLDSFLNADETVIYEVCVNSDIFVDSGKGDNL